MSRSIDAPILSLFSKTYRRTRTKSPGRDATALHFALASLRSFLDALRNHLGWPVIRRSYDAHPRAFSLVDENVRAKFVFYFGKVS